MEEEEEEQELKKEKGQPSKLYHAWERGDPARKHDKKWKREERRQKKGVLAFPSRVKGALVTVEEIKGRATRRREAPVPRHPVDVEEPRWG